MATNLMAVSGESSVLKKERANSIPVVVSSASFLSKAAIFHSLKQSNWLVLIKAVFESNIFRSDRTIDGPFNCDNKKPLKCVVDLRAFISSYFINN